MRSKKLNHIAAGLVASFVSRNNDVDGYWAMGMLYREAVDHGNSAVLDLLDPAVQTPASAADSVARHYAHFLHGAMQRQALAPDALQQARIDIQFDAHVTTDVPYPGRGDIFICRITLVDRLGHSAQRTVVGRCMPCVPGAFSQSSRA